MATTGRKYLTTFPQKEPEAKTPADDRGTALTYRVVEKSSKSREERFAETQAWVMKNHAATFEKLAK